MIYRMARQLGGVVIGALLMLTVIWFVPGVRAFPGAMSPAAPSTRVLAEAQAALQVIQYQGRLLDTVSGQPKPDGAYAFAFRIYATATEGTPLWTESKSITVNKGLFSTLLGEITPLDLALFNGQELYLGITIGTDPETAPRQRLAHVAYALYAQNADLLDGQDAGAFAAASHTHSGDQITAGTVAEPRIDSTVTRDDEVLPLVLAGDGSGSGVDADTLDGLDQSNFYKGATAVQYTETTPLAAGGQNYLFTFGYSADELVVWRVKPTVLNAKLRVEVETQLSNDNTVTYWLRVYNTGAVASGYQLIRHHFYQ